MKILLKCILVLVIVILAVNAYSGEKRHIYSTWDIMEIDTCASAWLIKRFVDENAEFKFYPKGEFITEGIPFDTPDAELRRRHGMSTFENIAAKYKIDDEGVVKIGKIIHEIEINYWGPRLDNEAKQIDESIKRIIVESGNPAECLEKSFIVLDDFYGEME